MLRVGTLRHNRRSVSNLRLRSFAAMHLTSEKNASQQASRAKMATDARLVGHALKQAHPIRDFELSSYPGSRVVTQVMQYRRQNES